MGKFIKWFIGVLVLLFIGFFFAWNMLPRWVSKDLTDRAKVTVAIGDIGATLNSINVNGVFVGNPPKRVLSKALTIKRINVDCPLTRFLDERIVIPKMEASNIYVGLEFDKRGSKRGNWSTIMDNLSKSTGPSSGEESDRSVLIKKLILKDLNIELAYTNEGGKTTRLKPIKRLEFDNVSSEGGLPTAQIMNIMMQEALRQIFSIENLQNMLEDLIPDGSSSGGSVNPLKGLFSENEASIK